MKKFKEFAVETHDSRKLSEALVEHAIHLGYKFDDDWGNFDFILGFEDGSCYLTNNSLLNKLSLDEFFALTPEDVIVEPERFNCRFYVDTYDGKHLTKQSIIGTQDQIDRVTAIMKENDSPVRSVS